MKYQVTGQRKDNGARETVAIDASSKSAAERKGRELGLEVRSVRDVSEGAATTPVVYGRRRATGGGLIRAVVVVAILLAVAWLAWTYVVPRFR